MSQPAPPGQELVANVKVPAEEASVVNFPGMVKNKERALELLGGAEVIANTLRQSAAPLKCRPRGAVRFLGT